jgi:hypothetical protein
VGLQAAKPTTIETTARPGSLIGLRPPPVAKPVETGLLVSARLAAGPVGSKRSYAEDESSDKEKPAPKKAKKTKPKLDSPAEAEEAERKKKKKKEMEISKITNKKSDKTKSWPDIFASMKLVVAMDTTNLDNPYLRILYADSIFLTVRFCFVSFA